MSKDWSGDTHAVYNIIGASNHCKDDREENDYYATSPLAVNMLLEKENFSKDIWEPACGGNHITKVLRKNGYNVRTSDIIDRVNDGKVEIIDFLNNSEAWNGDIITNPPYKFAKEFVEKSMESINDGNKVAMYLKLTFLEGKKRRELFKKYPPKVIYVAAARMGCARNGNFFDKENEYEAGAVAYAWYIWEKGFTGDPIIKWFND